jgi:hypothetical protein
MGTLKDIYDIIADLASRATSKKHKQEIEGLKSRIAELERNHQKEIAELEARLKEKHHAEIARLKQKHSAQIAAMQKKTLPKRSWVRDY